MQSFLREFISVFPGIESFLVMEPVMAVARIALILLGFFLCYLGYKKFLILS